MKLFVMFKFILQFSIDVAMVRFKRTSQIRSAICLCRHNSWSETWRRVE